MIPEKKWVDIWGKSRDKFLAYVDFNDYFEKSMIAGKELDVMDIGICSLPSGEVLVRDPLAVLPNRHEMPYFIKCPIGEYHTEVCVVKPDGEDCARYAAVRIKFSENRAVRFEEALTGNENLDEIKDFEEGDYFGFFVDAGLGCICDEQAHQAYCDFIEGFIKQNPDGNIYDDYFAVLFDKNYKRSPLYQREGGDWINWTVPGSEYHIPMFQSGFGDGAYPVYWGYDESGAVCQLVVQFIDIELAYAEE